MAATRIMPLHVGKGRTESRAISDIIDYVTNPKKTDNGRLITGYACDSRTIDAGLWDCKKVSCAFIGSNIASVATQKTVLNSSSRFSGQSTAGEQPAAFFNYT